jgi:hypothetical protein
MTSNIIPTDIVRRDETIFATKINRLMTLRRVQNKTAILQDIKRQKTQEAHLTAKSPQVTARREHIFSARIFCNKAAHAVGGSNAPEVSASAVATGATTIVTTDAPPNNRLTAVSSPAASVPCKCTS